MLQNWQTFWLVNLDRSSVAWKLYSFQIRLTIGGLPPRVFRSPPLIGGVSHAYFLLVGWLVDESIIAL